MEKQYNRIVLIGNGFDLAAGLNTSYKNFIDNYFKNAITQLFEKRSFESKLLTFNMIENLRLSKPKDFYIAEIKENIKTAEDALDYVKNYSIPQYNFDFFKEIIQELQNERWVDIEQLYYNKLRDNFDIHFKDNKKLALKKIRDLNNCMDAITAELHMYILNEQNSNQISSFDSPLFSVIDKCQEPLRSGISNLITRHKRTQKPVNVVFLNFNYTSTIRALMNNSSLNQKNHLIHIHGSIEDSSNRIIFGYGDDTGEDYKKLESVGENDLIRKIKSFEYPRTKNYHNLLNILENAEYDVFIIGHSCGLSDRTLLKTIFEHPNCLAIQNFHYKGEPEDFNKRMEISRHFTNKLLMRERVLPFDELASIPQAKKSIV